MGGAEKELLPAEGDLVFGEVFLVVGLEFLGLTAIASEETNSGGHFGVENGVVGDLFGAMTLLHTSSAVGRRLGSMLSSLQRMCLMRGDTLPGIENRPLEMLR